MSVLALIGSLARGKSWKGVDGKVARARVISELSTAVMLSVGVMAFGSYLHVDDRILAGLSVFAGWLGPATVSDLVLARIGVKGD